MALRRQQCRDHGGIFSYHPKRGRQPVSCKPETPCDRYEGYEGEAARQSERAAPHPSHAASDGAYLPSDAPKLSNPSLTLAKAAKERLMAVGWVVQGKGGYQGDNPECGHDWWAEITASRDHETLFMRWIDGELTDQNYAMEFEKPSTNGYPDNDLHFDPAELSDSELVRMLRGMKVTWWNTIGSSRETAIVNPKNVTVEHIFRDKDGEEDNSKRIIKFIDHGGGGFKAFHVAALLKVG